MKHYIYLTVVLVFLMIFSIAQSDDVQILLSGKVLNTKDEPIGTKIKLIDDKGRIINFMSNSIAGEYQQVVASNTTYHIYFDGYITANGNNHLEIPDFKKYNELVKNFEVQKIEADLELLNAIAFDPQKTNLSKVAFEDLENIKNMSKSQSYYLYYDCIIYTGDSKFKTKSKKVKEEVIVKNKKKVRTKTVKITPQEQDNELFENRKTALIEAIKQLGLNDKNFNFIHHNGLPNTRNLASTGKKNQKVNKTENLNIKIKKVVKL